ncbi:hypothetical protein [Aquiflexum balticum]|uniref:hypothetical protein n=1 Tax=Aquiflexum balticum TaxID=280473 RepID=UPI000A04853E|nr:hypothetical protein [Aquiflexum balticum]
MEESMAGFEKKKNQFPGFPKNGFSVCFAKNILGDFTQKSSVFSFAMKDETIIYGYTLFCQ